MGVATMVLMVAAFLGALGGALYFVVPPADSRTLKKLEDKLVLLAKRMLAGGIIGGLMSPMLMTVVDEVGWILDWTTMTAAATVIAAGYTGIDLLKQMLGGKKLGEG